MYSMPFVLEQHTAADIGADTDGWFKAVMLMLMLIPLLTLKIQGIRHLWATESPDAGRPHCVNIWLLRVSSKSDLIYFPALKSI